MHFLIESAVEKIWIDDLLEQQASRFCVGWNTIDEMTAPCVPRRRICRGVTFSLSALNTLSLVPFIDAVAMRVPSGFTVMQATSVSWAIKSC